MKSLRSHFIGTLGTSVGLLGINFITGVLVARLLSPTGRGEIAAITTWAQILGWASALGFSESVIYLQSKDPEKGPSILSTSLFVTAIFGSIGILIAGMILPHAFAAQTPKITAIAKVYMLTIYLSIAAGSFNALIMGLQDFRFMNFARWLQPALYLTGLLTIWACHLMTAENVLIISGITGVFNVCMVFYKLISSIGLGKPSFTIFREGFSYGLKLQGFLFGSLGNSRLDIMLMPAILVPAQIGLYSVSTNLATIVVSVLGSLCLIVFPTATRVGNKDGLAMVAKTLRLVLVAASVFAVLLFFTAPIILRYVYGAKFLGAVPSLRVLLPGVVLMAGTGIINSGLQAVNRPAFTSYAQIAGLLVTVLGLKLTLHTLGILGAALTSTVSYSVCFFVSFYFLCQEQNFHIRNVVSMRAFKGDVSMLVAITRRFGKRNIITTIAKNH